MKAIPFPVEVSFSFPKTPFEFTKTRSFELDPKDVPEPELFELFLTLREVHLIGTRLMRQLKQLLGEERSCCPFFTELFENEHRLVHAVSESAIHFLSKNCQPDTTAMAMISTLLEELKKNNRLPPDLEYTITQDSMGEYGVTTIIGKKKEQRDEEINDQTKDLA